MWRSEERLEFWLAGGRLSGKTGRGLWIRKLIGPRFSNNVDELPLSFSIRVVSGGDDLFAQTSVLNGLGSLDAGHQSPTEIARDFEKSAQMVNDADLLGPGTVRRLPMPDPQRTRIQQGRLIYSTKAQSITPEFTVTALRSIEPIQESRTGVKDGTRLLLPDAEVRSTTKIAELPHRQKSTDMENVKDSERSSFLREAEVLKHIPADRAELLAVFRHVPIEVISRLRFLSKSKEILFSIHGEARRTQTRVHDMAAVRDTATQDIHMVPHRTQFRVVPLTT